MESRRGLGMKGKGSAGKGHARFRFGGLGQHYPMEGCQVDMTNSVGPS